MDRIVPGTAPMTKTLRRGKDTTYAFMLTHTVLRSRSGRKLPCTVEEAKAAFEENKAAKMVTFDVIANGGGVCYQFMVGNDVYEMYSQRS